VCVCVCAYVPQNCQYGYLRRSSAPRIIVPFHCTFLVGSIREHRGVGGGITGHRAPCHTSISSPARAQDALYFGSRMLPVAVGKADLARAPIVGGIIKAMQVSQGW
jgi:hypothetical protein